MARSEGRLNARKNGQTEGPAAWIRRGMMSGSFAGSAGKGCCSRSRNGYGPGNRCRLAATLRSPRLPCSLFEKQSCHVQGFVDALGLNEATVICLRLHTAHAEVCVLRRAFRLRAGEMACQNLHGDVVGEIPSAFGVDKTRGF